MLVTAQRPRTIAAPAQGYDVCLISFHFDAFVDRVTGQPDAQVTVNLKRARLIEQGEGKPPKWEQDPHAFEGTDRVFASTAEFVKAYPQYASTVARVWEDLTTVGHGINAADKLV